MFVIAVEPTFTHPVEAFRPVDGGGHVKDTFKATFRVIEPEEAEGFNQFTAEGQRQFLERVVVSLDEIADATGKPITFTPEVFEAALKLPWARNGMVKAYFVAVSKAKEGN